jgi:uncharacterized protein
MYWIDAKLRSLEPILGTIKTLKLRQMYLYEDTMAGKKEVENYIDILVSKHVKKTPDETIILPPPKDTLFKSASAGGTDSDKSFSIGRTVYLGKLISQFSISPKDLTRHAGIFGSTGSGKTTFAAGLLASIIREDIPFIVLDWEKSYRFLAKSCPGIEIYTVGSDIHPIHFNLLDVPPGIFTDEHIKSLINLLGEDYLSGAGSDTMLLAYMKKAYQEQKNPTLNDLKAIIIREIQNDMKGRGRLSGRSGLWKETVQRIASFLSFGASHSVFGTDLHYPIPDLLNRKVVLELGNIKSQRDRKFIVHYLLNWLFTYMEHRGIEHENLKQLFIMEEFHNLTMQGKQDNLVSQMFRQCRKYGVGLVAIDQTPSEIPNAIFANINLMVSFSLNTQKDMKAMSQALNLDRFKERYLGMLKTGEAIAIRKQMESEPCQIQANYIEIAQGLTDSELVQILHDSDTSRADSHVKVKQSTPQTAQVLDISPPNPLEKVFLANIAERPLDGIEERTARLGLHPSQTVELCKDLEKKGLIRSVFVDRKKLIELTPFGLIACPVKRDTRGGIEHYYWITQTVQFLRNLGLQPVTEAGGIDITALEQSLAIEIETGKSDIGGNLLKLSKSGISHLFMLTTNKPAEFRIKELARAYPCIRTMHAKDFQKLSLQEILKQ